VSHDVLPNRENVFVIKTGKDYAKLLERYGNPLPGMFNSFYQPLCILQPAINMVVGHPSAEGCTK
jgi:hypothetical protein